MTFMACRYCFAFHEIDASGAWLWCCDEERREHERLQAAGGRDGE